MPIRLFDRVKQKTSTAGSGTLTLGSSVDAFVDFSGVFTNGDQTYYTIENATSFEVGIGTYNSGTLSRDTILKSSNNNQLLNLPGDANTYVFVTYPASGALYITSPSNGSQYQILEKVNDTTNEVRWIDNFAKEVVQFAKNSTHTSLSKGQVVYINGADGTNPTVQLAIGNRETSSSKVIGFLKQDLAQGELGYIITEGFLDGLNTNAASDAGDPMWLSPTISGGVLYGTGNKPHAPDHLVFLGYVIRKNTNNGRIYVKIQNGFELEELHNVAALNPSNGDTIVYSSASGLWLKQPLSSSITGAASGVAFFNNSNLLTTSTGLVFNSTSGYFGIGTTNPQYVLDIAGTGNFTRGIRAGLNSNDSESSFGYYGIDAGYTVTIAANTGYGISPLRKALRLVNASGDNGAEGVSFLLGQDTYIISGTNSASFLVANPNGSFLFNRSIQPNSATYLDIGNDFSAGQFGSIHVRNIIGRSGTAESQVTLLTNTTTSSTAVKFNNGSGSDFAQYRGDRLIGFGTSPTFSGQLNITTYDTGIPTLVLKKLTNQSANLFEIIDQSNNSLLVTNNNGNVGIGVSIPNSQLEINTTSSSNKGLLIKGAAAQSANLVEIQNSTGLNLFIVNNTGSVGIGTSSPEASLQINSNSPLKMYTAPGNLLFDIVTAGTSYADFKFYRPSSAAPGNLGGYLRTGTSTLGLFSADGAAIVVGNSQGAGMIDFPGTLQSRVDGHLHATYLTDLAIQGGGTYANNQIAGHLRLVGGGVIASETGVIAGNVYIYGGRGDTFGNVILAHTGIGSTGRGRVLIGTSIDNGTSILQVAGSSVFSGQLINSLGSITGSTPVTLTQTWNNGGTGFTGLLMNVTDSGSSSSSALMNLQVGGVTKFKVTKDSVYVSSTEGFQSHGTDGIIVLTSQGDGIKLNSAGTRHSSSQAVMWSNGTSFGNTVDLFLYRDTSNTLAQRNGTNAQTFRLYNTYVNSTGSYERGKFAWESNVLKIGTEKGSVSGSARALELQTDGVTRLTIASAGLATFSGKGVFTGAGDCLTLVRTGLCSFALGDADGDSFRILNVGDSSDMLRIHGTTKLATFYGQLQVNIPSSLTKGLIIKGAAAQSANLVELQDSAGTNLFSIESLGAIRSAPIWNSSGVALTGLLMNVTDSGSSSSSALMDLQLNGSSKFNVAKDGSITLGNTNAVPPSVIGNISYTFNNTFAFNVNGNGLRFFGNSNSLIMYSQIAKPFTIAASAGFGLVTSQYGGNGVYVFDEAANVWAQRNGTNAQTFRLYNTYTDTGNYENLQVQWSGNEARIGTSVGATSGTTRNLVLGTWNSSNIWRSGLAITPNNEIIIGSGTGARLYFANASGPPYITNYSNAGITIYKSAGSLGSLYASEFILDGAAGYLYFTNRGLMSSSANGVLHVQNFDRNESVDQALCFGPGTSPSSGIRLRRTVNTTTLAVRNGNDTADASITAASGTFSSGVRYPDGVTQTIAYTGQGSTAISNETSIINALIFG